MMLSCTSVVLTSVLAQVAPDPAAGGPAPVVPAEPDDAVIAVDDESFPEWYAEAQRQYFIENGLRCGLPERDLGGRFAPLVESPSDCTYTSTNPSAEYAPTFIYDIPVVVHVIQRTNGTGFISAAMVQSQIDVLNEDFRALAGTPGAPGTDTMIQFHLATEDPQGNPTNGITYSSNNTWFNDGGAYWNSLAWDTNRYLNIYTNNASGALGYVPDLPQGGIAGSNADRVVVLWSSFGFNSPIGPPFNKGRTTTHEVGHYFGLEHTFTGGCGSASACYTTGDLICDTNRQSFPNNGCGSPSSCGSPDPVHNYMDYSDDTCMWEFTAEQTRRMRCSIQHYRPDLPAAAPDPWDDIGNGLAGLTGVPALAGAGTLAGGDPVTLSLSNGRPAGTAYLILGFSALNADFKGGVMVPSLDILFPPLPIDGAGDVDVPFTWPVGLPGGTDTYWQTWIPDGAAIFNFAASNALLGTTP